MPPAKTPPSALPTAIIVFDLDGTLAETAGDLIATLNVILTRNGLDAVPFDQARGLIGAGAKALIERGFEQQNRALPSEMHERLFMEFLDYYGDHLSDHTALYEGVAAALGRFAEEGWKLAVCTNKIETHSRILLQRLGIADRFAAICGRDTFPMCKPDPRHLLRTIEAAGGDPLRAIMVGDSRTDIDTAKAAGIASIGVPFGYTDVPMAELEPTAMITHYDEIVAVAKRLMPNLGRGTLA